MWIIILAGAAARVITALVSDNINHPDEIFQVLEQAHRVVFGYGIIPWEYRLSARSWLVPGFMTVFLYPFKLFGLDNPDIYIPGMRIIMSLVSLSLIVSAYYIGKRLLSHRAGLWAALFCALWYEIIYFSIRPLSEVWAAIFFMAALAFSLNKKSHRALMAAGFLAVLAAAVRINYIPIAAVLIFLFYLKMDSSCRTRYLLGAAAAVVFVGIFEIVTLGAPFISYINFYNYDKSFFMTGSLGTTFSFDYIMFLAYASLFLYWVIIAAGFTVWKNTRVLLIIISVALISHIFIPAKEHQIDYRHIFVIIPVMFTMAGIISDRIIIRLNNYKILYAIITILFLVISVAGSLAALPGQNRVYHKKTYAVYDRSIFHKNGRLQAYRYLHRQDDIVSLFDNAGEWFYGGGYYYLHRRVPLYLKATPPPSAKYVSHLLSHNRNVIATGIRFNKSFGDFYLHTRVDSNYVYPVDSGFTFAIPQPGIDDSLNIQGEN